MSEHICTSGKLQADLSALKAYIDRVVSPMSSPQLKEKYLGEIRKYVTELESSEINKQFARR